MYVNLHYWDNLGSISSLSSVRSHMTLKVTFLHVVITLNVLMLLNGREQSCTVKYSLALLLLGDTDHQNYNIFRIYLYTIFSFQDEFAKYMRIDRKINQLNGEHSRLGTQTTISEYITTLISRK